MTGTYSKIARDGLWDNNVVFAQMLALCPTLAVTAAPPTGSAWGWPPRRSWWSPTC